MDREVGAVPREYTVIAYLKTLIILCSNNINVEFHKRMISGLRH